MEQLIEGHKRFLAEAFPGRRDQFHLLSEGQAPETLFVTCADSRIVPNMLLQTGPGETFTERTPGNIVPRYSDHVGGVTASMEYAVMVLRVPLVIICGHTDCGVMKALLEPEQTAGMPALQNWMRHALGARERLLREPSSGSREEKIRRLTEYNVLTQMENLRTHPAVEAAMAKGELEIHGWLYDIAHGEVSAADPETGSFHPLIPAEQ